jgi:hypothetical protein
MAAYVRLFKWTKILLALTVFVAAVTMGSLNQAYG